MPAAILTPTDKYVGLLLASYADPDGTRILPGTDTLIAVSGTSKSTIIRARTRLRDGYLIDRVSERYQNGIRGGTDEYRLTIPDDILRRYELLDPDVDRVSRVTPGKPRKLSTAAT